MSIMKSRVKHKENKFSAGDINNIHTNTFVISPPSKLSNSYLRSSLDAINFIYQTDSTNLNNMDT
jgi:hypothetical protein